jgi:uncharacterized protein (TIGR03000 family)
MTHRALFAVLAALASLGASYESDNFKVEAPTRELAERVALDAEQHRKDLAVLWLGQEMPTWERPCSLEVKLAFERAAGATSFAFDRDQVLTMDMHIEGSRERVLASILPHEVTHTVFAHHFRCPLPRWADEGGCVLSEDRIERRRHDMLTRQILDTPGRAIPLRRLFKLKDYPRDVMVLYAEGYSVTRFLVAARDRATFLSFVQQGMDDGWDDAVRKHYDYDDVDDLEQAWLASLGKPGTSDESEPARLRRTKSGKKADPDPQPATIVVHLPEDARLFVDGKLTHSRSGRRRFSTPPLEPGRDFHYTLRAQAERDGRPATISKEVTVRAGKTTTVTLSFAEE